MLNYRAKFLHKKGREPFQVRIHEDSYRYGSDRENKIGAEFRHKERSSRSYGATYEGFFELGEDKKGTVRFTVEKNLVDDLRRQQKLADGKISHKK
ncbi:hypothetical protein Slin15195_G037390 [Septoria linicola]|uniref:Uncharacterized protein n=1 Tax=Septoria linicola TaxID=215465 RepID=A0A9Q9AJY9_9PEZI|nr:hypothetical protein Slin14017_G118800 [Septoria linicola]USW50420.1 hypothetical protein Slin15195_G037390 [Septoria linicola]